MGFFKNIFGNKEKSTPNNTKIVKMNVPEWNNFTELGQITLIFNYTLDPDFTIAKKAAETIHKIFNSISVYKNKDLYENFKYLRINKNDIKKLSRFDEKLEITLLCISSMNGNGYSREEALSRLICFKTQRTIPFILFRLADWVIPVRNRALLAVKDLLIEENTIYFIRNHKLVSWLLQVKRADLSELHEDIEKSIISKKLRSSQVIKLNEGQRLFYYKLLLSYELIDNNLINEILKDKYYLIRLLLVKHFNKVENSLDTLKSLLCDKSQKVRQNAINLIPKLHLKEYELILNELIYDQSTYVRNESRQLLTQISDYNFDKIYRENLSKEKLIIGSLLGLSEVSGKNDIPLIQKYLNNSNIKIKSASLLAIYNLDTNIGAETAYEILETDSFVKTRRTAENILTKEGVNFKRLRILYDTTDITGKKIILRLFNRYSNWSVAGDFLKALTEEDAKVQLMARVFLESWSNYTIRLATKQLQEDKNYVLNWYKKVNDMGIQIPRNIPFIFGEK